MRNTAIALIGGLVLTCSVVAQEAKPPALLAKGKDGVSAPLRVDELEVEVKVVGNVAETVMTLRFRNDTDRILEGELVFPLGEGRTVSRYALEVNGKMREGVSIPKKRGRAVFESVVRKEIDPGLLEWTKGNSFRTRIYPIPAKGTKSVRVGYEEELAERDGQYVYQLPLEFQSAIDRFHLVVEVVRPAEEAGAIQVEGGLELKRRGAKAWIVEAEEKNYAANKALSIKIPRERAPAVLVEESGGVRYFHVLDRPEVPGRTSPRARPKSIRLVWDASESGNGRDVKKELDLLGRYLEWVGETQVELVWLRNDLEAVGSFAVRGGNWQELKAVLEKVRYDGGTRLGLLDFRAVKEEVVILVSDGVSTLGKGNVPVGTVPVFALHGSQSAEHGLLRAVAAQTGGEYVNLMATGVEDGLKAMTENRFSLVKAEVEGPGETPASEIYPSVRRAVTGAMGVAGILEGQEAVTLVLHYGWGGKGEVVRKIVIDPAEHRALVGRAPRLWAQKKLEELELNPKGNRAGIVELAKAHGMVTRFTSLIVLDRIEDYVEHRIVPPEPAMRKKYEQMLKNAPDPDEPDLEHLKEMLVQWKERTKWHAKKFPGREEVVFQRIDQLRKVMDEAREELQEFEKEAKDPEEKKMLAEAKAILGRFDEIQKAAERLSRVDKKARDAKWNAESAKLAEDAQALFAAMPGQGGAGAAAGGGEPDPFGGDGGGAGGGAVRFSARVGALFGGAVAPDAEDAPEIPRQVQRGGALGGAVFPVTPATPVDPAGPQPARLPPAAANGANDAHPFAAAPAKKADGEGGAVGDIALAKWDPKTPYLAALKKAKEGADLEAIYFEWKKKHVNSSAFYLDVADFFMERKEPVLALRILTNVAEMNLESVPLLRILGHRLDQLGELELAELVFREVKDLRSDEPQSWRDLALVLEKRGRFQDALDVMWPVVINEWSDRFPGIQMIVLTELNALVARKGESLDLSAIDERFLRNLDADVRIILTWDADNTDMDLWVTDPVGERCDYSYNRTITGGRMSEDFTGGYGPEEFLVRRALPGSYKVQTEFYGNQQQVLAGATTIQAVLITNWGRPGEKRRAVTLRLTDEKDAVEIGTLKFEMGGAKK